MGALDRVLLAAQDEDGIEQAHEHLMKECPWYRAVSGGEAAGVPDALCKPAGGKVALTPRTPEASTVVKPTVPPGGPGLFHIKGRNLPPYMEHLWFHLVKRYGKHDAYRVANGIVHKWAAGINPGGRHPTKTHPDVRAAAAKNIAQWEKDKADAHAQSRGHVKASAGQDALVLSGKDGPPYPGQEQIALPPVPKATVPKTMYTAHRVDDCLRQLSHAGQRLVQAKKSRALRAYHMEHVNNHLSHALDSAHQLAENVQRNYPAEARELAALSKTLGLAVSVSPEAKAATFAHLLQTVLYHQAHAKRHAEVMRNPDPDPVWRFNYEHAHAHMKGALEHCYKLARHLEDNYPDEARYLEDLGKAADPHDPYTGLTAIQAAGKVLLALPYATAPGAAPIQKPGLYERPAQTVSASPVLPPDVPLPTAGEIRKILAQVPDCSDKSLSQSARHHLDAAVTKLEKDDPLAALHVLRSAQSDIYACHKADLGALGPAQYTANVFARTVPAAERSSANTAMLQSKGQEMKWRSLEQQVARAIDRIRRKHFHGMYPAGMQQARFSKEDDMSALDKVLRAAGPPLQDEPDRSALIRLAGVLSSHSTTPKPDAHQLHVEHVEHVAHVAHLHVEHLKHLAHMAHAGRK